MLAQRSSNKNKPFSKVFCRETLETTEIDVILSEIKEYDKEEIIRSIGDTLDRDLLRKLLVYLKGNSGIGTLDDGNKDNDTRKEATRSKRGKYKRKKLGRRNGKTHKRTNAQKLQRKDRDHAMKVQNKLEQNNRNLLKKETENY